MTSSCRKSAQMHGNDERIIELGSLVAEGAACKATEPPGISCACSCTPRKRTSVMHSSALRVSMLRHHENLSKPIRQQQKAIIRCLPSRASLMHCCRPLVGVTQAGRILFIRFNRYPCIEPALETLTKTLQFGSTGDSASKKHGVSQNTLIFGPGRTRR